MRPHHCLCLCMALGCFGSPLAGEPAWEFDSGLLRGSGLSGAMVEYFNHPYALLPGVHHMELYVNGKFITRMDIRFVGTAHGEVRPCLKGELWQRIGVAEAHIQEGEGECPALIEQVAGSSFVLDVSRMQLSLSVPRILMRHSPPNVVAADELDAGQRLLFFNYMGNAWHAERSGRIWAKHQDSAHLSLTGGANFGLWQYRQQGHLSLNRISSPHWHNLSSRLQRPLPGIGSQLTLGQLYTGGHFFSGLAYHGASLANDERMLAEDQRGFSPVVRGVAASNAKVTIRQKGREIYQTTVAPGAFVIDDLTPASRNGDLEVIVEEADGTVNTFKVPFSALPQSLRPGRGHYNLAFGRTRNNVGNSYFADASYRRGVSNTISAGTGVRVAVGYQALAADAVYLSRAGAIGLTVSHSRASVPGRKAHAGWRAGLSYSHTFAPTHTHFALAAYRYSTASYRDLNDVLGERFANRTGGVWQSDSYRQRARFDISVNQTLGEYGYLYLSGSMHNWHYSHQHERQWQLGYSTMLAGRIGFNLSLLRQYTAFAPVGQALRRDDQLNLSLSMPLGSGGISTGYSRSGSNGNQYDMALSGSGERSNWHLGANRAQRKIGWNLGLQQQLPNANLGFNYSRGPHHWQLAGNVQGAFVVHGGGLTFGPWLGDTFALVEAKGAKGARVGGHGRVRVDRFGYALVPSLTPYRYNRVFLDPQDADIELENAEQRSAPYAGAAVKLTFQTRHGQALLIHVNAPEGQSLPPGTPALDAAGNVVGLLGQGNWLYLRSESGRGQLYLPWGRQDQRCRLVYDSTHAPVVPLVRLQVQCLAEGAQEEQHYVEDHDDMVPPSSSAGGQE